MVATALAACSGGGGSSPAPVASAAPLLPKVVERDDFQSRLAVLEALTLFAEFTAFPGGADSPTSVDGSCAQSQTETTAQTGPVSYTVVITHYYDIACTQPHVVINGNMRDNNSGSLFATKTTYSRGGSTTGYDTIDVTTASISSPIGVAITAASTVGGQPTTRQNLLCTRSQPIVCSAASTTSLIDGSMLGASFVLTIDEAAYSDVLSVTSPVHEYASSAGNLTIAAAATGTLTIAGSPLLVSTSCGFGSGRY